MHAQKSSFFSCFTARQNDFMGTLGQRKTRSFLSKMVPSQLQKYEIKNPENAL